MKDFKNLKLVISLVLVFGLAIVGFATEGNVKNDKKINDGKTKIERHYNKNNAKVSKKGENRKDFRAYNKKSNSYGIFAKKLENKKSFKVSTKGDKNTKFVKKHNKNFNEKFAKKHHNKFNAKFAKHFNHGKHFKFAKGKCNCNCNNMKFAKFYRYNHHHKHFRSC